MTRQSRSLSAISTNTEPLERSRPMMDSTASSPFMHEQAPDSTPPTSVEDQSVGDSVKEKEPATVGRRKSARVRPNSGSYNLKQIFDKCVEDEPSPEHAQSLGSRKVSELSGKTLVGQQRRNSSLRNALGDGSDATELWEDDLPKKARTSPRKLERRPSVKDKVKNAISKAGSVLGKRSREVMEKGKDKLARRKEEKETSRILKQLDMGSRSVLDEMDLDAETTLPPAKKVKKTRMEQTPLAEIRQSIAASNPAQRMSNGKNVKKWQTAGLYVGQDVTQSKKLQKKRPDSVAPEVDPAKVLTAPKKDCLNMTLPMFSYLERERNFTIPFDVFAPSLKKGDERPKDWHQLNRNRLIGDAKERWAKEEKLAKSVCMCKPPADGEEGCGDQCLNRSMEYECNNDNCPLSGTQCSNRAFSELSARLRKGGQYDIGVEVVKTSNRGFGVRSCRSFNPGQIIMEYTGEIITTEECERRMHEVYIDKNNFYLMEMENGFQIDGTKGSMARFINHSCAPNCTVRLVKVGGAPRMGIFAGDEGVMTGEELTYDYNFDNFSTNMQPCFCGAPNCRGYLGKKLNAVEKKKQDKLAAEKKRKVQEEAMRAADAAARAKQKKSEQEKSGWRGWLDLEDPEVRKRIKTEQEEKKAQAMTSDRARRAVARKSLPATNSPRSKKIRKAKPNRRRTMGSELHNGRVASDSSQRALLSPELGDEWQNASGSKAEQKRSIPEEEEEQSSARTSVSSGIVVSHKVVRIGSNGSRFVEDLSRPASSEATSSTVTRHTEAAVGDTPDEAATANEKNFILLPTDVNAAEAGRTVDKDGDIELPDSEEERTEKEKTAAVDTKDNGKPSRKRSVLKKVEKIAKGVLGSSNGAARLKQSTLKFSRIS